MSGRIIPANGHGAMPTVVQMTPMNDAQVLCIMAAWACKDSPAEAAAWAVDVMAHVCLLEKHQSVAKRLRELESEIT